MRRSFGIALALIAAVVLVGAAGLCLRSREVYGTFAFWGVPERIDYCERRYYPSPTDVRGSTSEVVSVGANEALKVVGHTYMRRPILAAVVVGPGRTVPCTMTVYVRTGANRYRSFGLSGGP